MIVVVGGGITGLALGAELARRELDFVVLEATHRPGGVIRSGKVAGRVLDWGPQRTRLTRGIADLVGALGLDDEVVTAPADLDLFVYRDGRLRRVPFSVGGFLRSDVVGWRAKARVALEPFTRGADPGERVSTYFTRKLGHETYQALVAPLYGGLYASDPADMEVGLSLLPTLRSLGVKRSLLLPLLRRGGRIAPPPPCSFREGMETLPRALATSLGDRIRFGTPVRRLERTRSGWRVDGPAGGLEAEHVVVTTPAPAVADLLREATPSLARAVGSLRYNPLAVVHLEATTELRGLGFQVAFTDADMPLRGVTFNDSLFARRDLYTAYLGGALHPRIAGMNEEALGRAAVDGFRRCTGHDAVVLSVARTRMPAWDVSWHALDGLDVPRGLHLAGNWRSRPGLPGRLDEARRLAKVLASAAGRGEADDDELLDTVGRGGAAADGPPATTSAAGRVR